MYYAYRPRLIEDTCRWLYSLLISLLIPFAFINLIVRGLVRQAAYNKRRFERFGFLPPIARQGGMLLHCVSVGEVVAASALVKRILAEQPDMPITITTTTPTGSARVQAIFADQVQHFYLPYDLHMAMAGMLRRVRPKKVLIMEVELWPNLIHACWKRHIPVYIVNARMTDKSARNYGKFSLLFSPMLHKISKVCAQGKRDYANYLSLGLAKDKLLLSNNIKFDQATMQQQTPPAIQALAMQQRVLWVAGSTHEPEEQIMLQAHQQLLVEYPELLLVLVPRHPERFTQVVRLCEGSGLRVQKFSQADELHSDTQVLVVDQMGVLSHLYQYARFAFVGGSIARRGGHNALEVASQGVPVIMGEHTYNNPVICQTLLDVGALVSCQTATQVVQQARQWLCEPKDAQDAGQAGLAILQHNQGALDLTMDAIFNG